MLMLLDVIIVLGGFVICVFKYVGLIVFVLVVNKFG